MAEKKSIGYKLFLISYTLYIFYKLIYGNSNFKLYLPSILSVAIYGIYLLFLVKIAITKFNVKSLIAFVSLLILSLIIYYFSKDLKIFELILIIFAARDIEFYDIAKTTKINLIILTTLVVISSLIGIIPNYLFYRTDGTLRQSLGFTYLGQLPAICLEVIFLDIILREKKGKKVKSINIIVYLLLSFAVYKITDGRNIFYLSVILLIFYIVSKIRPKIFENKIVRFIFINSFLICFIVSIIMTTIYNPTVKWHSELNNLLSNRLYISNNMLNQYNINLFGNYIPTVGVSGVLYGGHSWSEYSYIDNLYIQLLLKDGLVVFVIIAYSYIMTIWKALKHKNYNIVIWFFIMTISSIVADSLISIMYNCMILGLFNILKNKTIWGENKNDTTTEKKNRIYRHS